MSRDSYYDMYVNLPVGFTEEQWHGAKEPVKCTCGMLITMGEAYPKHKHSDWCEMYQKEDENATKG